nr:hypothetical protein [uncultured Celeribacter sp.]
MSQEVSDIKAACEQVMLDFADAKPNWKYVKSKRCFVRSVSKSCFVDVYTGMSSKVDFVNFQFSLNAGHRLIGMADKFRKGNNWAIIWVPEKWLDNELNWGRCTVFDHRHPHLGELEFMRSQGKLNYVRLEEFSERLDSIFSLAEAEITELFDLSSEEALIRSLVNKPIGFFRPNEVLLVQMLLQNPAYYEELVEFYGQPLEAIRSSPYRVEPFNRQAAELMMEQYRQGDFPKFDFV